MPFGQPPSPIKFESLSAAYLQDEASLTQSLARDTRLDAAARARIQEIAAELTTGLLADAAKPSVVDAFLAEFTLGSEEGILLMRLAESLIRTPDAATARLLLRDKLLAGNWGTHLSTKSTLVKLGTLGLLSAKTWARISGGAHAQNLFAKIGDRIVLPAVRRAISVLGRHYVLGTSISRATQRARAMAERGATYSYDMLGEAALTETDAQRYFNAYKRALTHLAQNRDPDASLHAAPALSVKLSALHPRYEYAQRDRCVPVLAERVLELCRLAKAANIGLTIDAEEAERLEVSLLVVEGILSTGELSGWEGFGLALQAYQRRATNVVDWVIAAAQRHDQKFTVRLVKGAYWDSEIKRAQTLGLSDYPVFTRKEHTDISYLACARKLLDAKAWIYPQFATHNAHTAAAILKMAGDRREFEFQRLHGMSDGLHRRLSTQHGVATRTYAPVGRHHELLPYLVRRLLENGANASFVNQLQSETASVADLIRDPIEQATKQLFAAHPKLGRPVQRTGDTRMVAEGEDLTQSTMVQTLEHIPAPARLESTQSAGTVAGAMTASAKSSWPERSAEMRAKTLRNAADLLERDRQALMALCVHEAKKTWPDAEAELREAVDFLRYYADESVHPSMVGRPPLGPVACISPWNFPLAIFLGQVSAALSMGNTVIAKPAEQTPHIAIAAVERLHSAGIPKDALQLVIGDGRVGAELVRHPDIQGVCFTGSTQTAKRIAQTLAETGRGDIPLIAETGGINAMIIDSTALLEQAVQDVVDSAFQSAGQRCSACRLVCVQDDIADAFIDMLNGAISTLRVADPAYLSTDLGPLIDEAAHDRVAKHIADFKQRFDVLGEAPSTEEASGTFVTPIAFGLNDVSDLTEEVFGPVLHVVRFKAGAFEPLIEKINKLGFGLTMGLHSRIDARVALTQQLAKVGNLYINRNQIGAVVGEQPFGGEGLSGTGPKAGGPNYLKRLSHRSPSKTDACDLHEVELPAPTGERNTLRHVPRGRLLCLGGDAPEDLPQQIARVRATGNDPVVLNSKSVYAALEDPQLKGVVIEGRRRADIARRLAHRDGALLPLLSRHDEDYRYALERVITIDTTAAGGNARLLAEI
ncbi:MAG: L-glutamate gamma-semialdehyde dehydrogenase [Pseudomonadota bacterium]